MFKHHLKHSIYLTNSGKLIKVLAVGICLNALNVYADDTHPDIEAKTSSGESVICTLTVNGNS